MYVDVFKCVDRAFEVAERLLVGGNLHGFARCFVVLEANQLIESALAGQQAGAVLGKLALECSQTAPHFSEDSLLERGIDAGNQRLVTTQARGLCFALASRLLLS